MPDVIDMGEYQLTMQRQRMTCSTAMYKTKLSEMAEKVAECEHKKLIFLEHGDVLQCKDCGAQVTATWAFIRFAEEYRQRLESWDFQRRSLQADIERGVTLRAAQKIEDAWRRRKVIPCCPHCHKAILPDNNFGGSGIGTHTKEAQGALILEYKDAPQSQQC